MACDTHLGRDVLVGVILVDPALSRERHVERRADAVGRVGACRVLRVGEQAVLVHVWAGRIPARDVSNTLPSDHVHANQYDR